MSTEARLRLNEVEGRVCDIASEQLGIPRVRISPGDRIIEDLHCDSLDLVELLMEVEVAFGITLPEQCSEPGLQSSVHPATFPPVRSGRTGLSPARQRYTRPEKLAYVEVRAAAVHERPFHPTRWTMGARGNRPAGTL